MTVQSPQSFRWLYWRCKSKTEVNICPATAHALLVGERDEFINSGIEAPSAGDWTVFCRQALGYPLAGPICANGSAMASQLHLSGQNVRRNCQHDDVRESL